MFHVNHLGSHHGKSFSLHKPARGTEKEQNPGEVEEEEALPLLRVENSGCLALLKGFIFLGDDGGELSLNPCKLRVEVIPSNSPGAFGLCRISWDVSPCVSPFKVETGVE